MQSTQFDSPIPKRPPGVKLRSTGPVARIAKALGISLAEVGRRISVNVASLRTWDARDNVPPEVAIRMHSLLLKKKARR